MNPRVVTVEALSEHKLSLTFSNGEKRIFDVAPYLTKGIFSILADSAIFSAVKVFNGSVLWPGDLDFCPDTLYEQSKAA
jgi:hypothetical protein